MSLMAFVEIGRAHLILCRKLAREARGLNAPIEEAAVALPTKRLRGMTMLEIDELLNAVPLAAINGEPLDAYASYIFNCSIFVAAIQGDPMGILVQRAGRAAAHELERIMLMALQSGELGFIRLSGTEMLDQFGDMLGQAYFRVASRGFRVAADVSEEADSLSRMDRLAAELRTEESREEGLRLLPLARQQCAGEEHLSTMLDNFELMLRGRPAG